MDEQNVSTMQEAAEVVTTATAEPADQRDAFLEGFDDDETVMQADRQADGGDDVQDAEEAADRQAADVSSRLFLLDICPISDYYSACAMSEIGHI